MTFNPVREEYDRLAPVYDRRWRPYIDATLQSVIDALRLEGRERILDLACGTGELEGRLLQQWPGLQITAVDLSPKMLEQAQAKDFGARITWLQADAASSGLPDDSFDCLVCANSFHYFPRPLDSLQEMRRMLRSAGTLVLVDWCDDYLACKVCSLWLRWTDPAFHQAYSMRGCGDLLHRAGFHIREQRHFRTCWVWGMMQFLCSPAML